MSAGSAHASSLTLNFNATSVAAGDAIWFNSVVDPTLTGGITSTTIFFSNSKLSFTDDKGVAQVVNVPNAILNYSTSGAAGASTSFASDTWTTNITGGLSSNVWMSGFQLVVPVGHDYKGLDITWSADFTTNTPGKVSLQWKGAAADYIPSAFKADPNALNVKPSDALGGGDHAGTPEAIAVNGNLAGGGATGGAGSNWTGSYSGTVSVTPGTPTGAPGVPLPSAAVAGLGLLGVLASTRRRRS